jgi:betaine-aldehyde dehydrogenase
MSAQEIKFPEGKGLYYGGRWNEPRHKKNTEIFSPSTGERLTTIQEASEADVPAVVAAARAGFEIWRDVAPIKRATLLRRLAVVVRSNARELALLDALDCGSPVSELLLDVEMTAILLEYFAGLVTEMKGSSVPAGPDTVTFSVREPCGVVLRIAPFNHPFVFAVGKAASALAAGNAVIVKPAEQAPLSALRGAELFEGILPPGVFNVVAGGRDFGAALVADPGVAMIAFIGSISSGKAVMRSASDRLKRVVLELGGKNALIAFPDSSPDKVAAAMIAGMNFAWCGQSCGSTSRAFVHADIYDAVIERLALHAGKFKPGLPTDPKTTMGALIDRRQLDRVNTYIEAGKAEGARLVYGGKAPLDDALKNGCFLEPTIFADVTMDMRIAREEIFGPILSVLRWSDEADMLRQVNQLDYGLTCAVWTRDVAKAHRLASRVEAGVCWINDVGRHSLGSPFGGYKQSGFGREECLEELLAFTQEKNIFINLNN